MVSRDDRDRQVLDERLARFVDLERDRRFHSGRVACDLRAIRAILERLGRPQDTFRAVHVAGSWGKGSTAVHAASVLEAAGWSVGLYTSPHLVDPCERIRLGGRAVNASRLRRHLDDIGRQAERAGIPLTYFEALTAAAFTIFREEGCRVAVVEVGLGGRLDATNTVRPVICAVTAIQLEHTRILGADVEQIAREKAGILEAGIPVVLGSLAAAARAVVLERARALHAPVIEPEIRLETDLSGISTLGVDRWGGAGLRVDLGETPRFLGQWTGLGLVLGCLAHEAMGGAALEEPLLRRAASRVVLPGRWQILRRAPAVILDGAHSPEGVQAVLDEAKRRWQAEAPVVVLGLLADKDARGILRAAVAVGARLVLTRPRSPRAWDPEELADLAGELGARARVITDPRAALRQACTEAGPDGLVVVTGSLYLAGLLVDQADVWDLFDRRSDDGAGQSHLPDGRVSREGPPEHGNQAADELPQQPDPPLPDAP